MGTGDPTDGSGEATDDPADPTDGTAESQGPGLARKLAFWALLGLVSTAFAEVLFPHTPFALVLLVVPVYLLHTVVLAGVVYAADAVTFPSLYLAGAVFGLWEAYLTKVVWVPVRDPIPVRVAGVYPFETAALVLFWHPLVAFVLPVVLVEAVATASRRSLVGPFSSDRSRRRVAVVAGAYLALFQGSLGAGPSTTLVSNVATLAVLFGALAAWRHAGGHRFRMGALLPAGRELPALGVALLAVYPLVGATLRPDALPVGPVPHLVVLGLYAVLGGALALTLVRGSDRDAGAARDGSTDPSRADVGGGPDRPGPRTAAWFGWRPALAVAGAFVLASTLASLASVLAPSLAFVVFLLFFALGPLVGLLCLGRVVRWHRRRSRDAAGGG